MNWRAVFIISFGLNILLGAAVLKSRPAAVDPAEPGPAATVTIKTNRVTRNVTHHIELPPARPLTEVVWPQWSDIARDDWRGYRLRLEQYGCPADTLRDILGAELQRQYSAESEAVIQPVSRVFWDVLSAHRFDLNGSPFKELDEALDGLREKYQKLGSELFDGLKERSPAAPGGINAQYAHLSDEVQVQLTDLDARFNEGRNAIFGDPQYRATNNQLTTEGQALLKELEGERIARRRELMSADEFHEYRLRSTGAANWASQLAGFEPTGEEYRQVAEWKLALDDEHPLPGRHDPGFEVMARARQEAEAGIEAQMKELLGEERFAAYDRSKQSDYQQLHELGDQFALPESKVNQAWEMQRMAINTAAQIRADDSLTPDEQRAALGAIQQETRQSFESLLTDEIFQAYRLRNGQWIDQLLPAGN